MLSSLFFKYKKKMGGYPTHRNFYEFFNSPGPSRSGCVGCQSSKRYVIASFLFLHYNYTIKGAS